MIPNENAIVLFRFGEQRWIDKIINGELSFSCIGAFVNQAIKTNNDVQGDKYEGVFARLLEGDKRINEMHKRFGSDLEVITEGDYRLLRRKSAQLVPIYCYYNYRAVDILAEREITQLGNNVIRHDFHEKMYSGFSQNFAAKKVVSDSHRFTQLTIYPKPFVEKIKIAMVENGYGYIMKSVDYDTFAEDTFFVEPTADYPELFYKFPQYKYQYESRICMRNIKFNNITERFTLNYLGLKEGEYYKTFDPFYIDFSVDIQRK